MSRDQSSTDGTESTESSEIIENSESTQIELQLQFGNDGPPHKPVDDQKAVMKSYFEDTGRVVVDASAGTGKTTTLVVTLAETIVRNATETHNPLSEILVTTFGRDATAELKTRLKELLRHHVDNGGELPQTVFRWIETESQIQTLDSFFAELLREIAVEVGVPPDFTVDDRIELQRIRDEVFADLREDHRGAVRELTQAYPTESWREYPPQSVEEMLSQAHQNCREFGISTTDAVDSLRESLTVGHGGDSVDWLDADRDEDRKDERSTDGPDSIPPENVDDITAILRAVVDEDAALSADDPDDAQQLLAHVRETYFATEDAIDAFATLLEAFERGYDRRTKRAGQFTFRDVAHLLERYLSQCAPTHPFRQTVGRRFEHVFVDEFQDTSAVQCAVVRRLVDPESVDTDAVESKAAAVEAVNHNAIDTDQSTNLFVIGDSKQAIYEWRSADPALFAEIIETTRAVAPEPAPRIPHLDVRNVRYHALTTVFRHHPDIAAAANHVFQQLLEDGGRGAIGRHTPSYVPVEPYDSAWEADADREEAVDTSTHLHVLNVDAATNKKLNKYMPAATWATAEATRIAETIATITDPDIDEPPVTIEETDETGATSQRQPTPGDITLLFRSTRQMERYAATLREYGIAAEAVASGDLFEQPEIRLLVDILSWISTPHSDKHLRRLLRSPLVALSDDTVRTIVASNQDLETLLKAWPTGLPEGDRQRLDGFCSLRDDLRWMRETSKTALIHRLLQHSGLDGVILSDTDPLRRYGNLWLLIELVDDWEVDELLTYREFISRLQQLRNQPDSADPQFSVAEVADHETSEAVTLTTVHGAKGQEYPIVFLCDLIKQSTFPRLQADRLLMSRQYGFALRPRPGSTPSPKAVQFPTPDQKREQSVWFNDDFDTRDFPDVTGPIWLSDARTDTGEFRYPNPLNAHLTARESEFWRLAYVAFTRAKDHVFLGLGPIDDDDGIRWTTWLAGFNETLQPDCGWSEIAEQDSTNRTVQKGLSWTTETGETISKTIPIGVDEIPPNPPEPTKTLDLTDELAQLPGSGDAIEHPSYRPRTVSASSLSELADCPRAFQYRHVQQVEAARRPSHSDQTADTIKQSTPTPGKLAPNEWGDTVHRMIEYRLGEATPPHEQFIQRQPEAVEASLRTVLTAVEASTVFEQCLSEATTQRFAEYELTHLVSTAGADLRVTGTIDLLYQADGGWHIVDWKTGARPGKTNDVSTTHTRQLSVYAWLLEQRFGIEVDTATLVYIDPESTPIVSPVALGADLDTEWVDQTITAASESMPLTSEAGLETRPGPDVCGSCPYAASVGGPCTDDYYATDSSESQQQ